MMFIVDYNVIKNYMDLIKEEHSEVEKLVFELRNKGEHPLMLSAELQSLKKKMNKLGRNLKTVEDLINFSTLNLN